MSSLHPPVPRVLLIGAGDRGTRYAKFIRDNPQALRLVGLAEPVAERRARIAREHKLRPDQIFDDWRALLADRRAAGGNADASERSFDGVIIATQDRQHVEPALRALRLGAQVLLEKPLALSRNECERLVSAAEASAGALYVCHVLRYTEFFRKVRAIIAAGLLGEVRTIFHAENVSYFHMAHSYVRGNWASSRLASPMILAKCCHDLDLIHWFAGARPTKVASFGRLDHFRPENAPLGAPARCTDGCPAEADCQFEARATYLHGRPVKRALAASDRAWVRLAARFLLRFPGLARRTPWLGRFVDWREWPTSTITEDLTPAGVLRALREGPYGRCVYRCDNDQVDHQETIVEFENGVTATLRMHGHAAREGRTLRIDGSRGTLRGAFQGDGRLELERHDGAITRYRIKARGIGHEEGDEGIMRAFAETLRGKPALTDARESLQSHLMAFAADEARRRDRVIKL